MAMGSQSHRRRRRRRSSPSRVVAHPVRVSSGRRFRLRSGEALASLAVAITTVSLIALVWITFGSDIEAYSSDQRTRVEASLAGHSVVLVDQVRHEILGVEQSLRVLKQAFQADPDHFDMKAWRDQMMALTDVTDDAFVADAQFIIQHDINPQGVGLGVGSRVSGIFGLMPDRMDREDHLLIGQPAEKLQDRQHYAFMAMPLDRPHGWIIGATYRTSALTRLFTEAGLGRQGMAALIDTRLGWVQAITGPAAANPNYNINASAMFGAMKNRPDGTWIGPSASDNVQRIHAFHRVPGRELSVVVAVNEADAMKPAAAWAEGTREVAAAATLVILGAASVALFVILTYRSKHRLRQDLERELLAAARTHQELAEIRARLDSRGAQVRALFNAIAEGALLLDAELRVMEWNPRFPTLFAIPPDTIQPGLPLDELLRRQAREGMLGSIADVEQEVARRLAQLRTATADGVVLYGLAGGEMLEIQTAKPADNTTLLVVRQASEQELGPALPRQAETEPDPIATSGAVETL